MRKSIAIAIFAIGLLTPYLVHASGLRLETTDLIVSDDRGNLSDERLRDLTNHAQEALGKVLAFWSADPRIDQLGKIRVVFDNPLRDIYGSLFTMKKVDGKPRRVVSVYGSDGMPQMMTHKLTSAVFPNKDKLIRNMMGPLTEAKVGNPISFPMCGFSSDDWVLALLTTGTYIPLDRLGPDHESWGMREIAAGRLSVFDTGKQHKAYAEASSFGGYLFQVYGANTIKRFYRLSHEKERPWQEAFGADMHELEARWLAALKANEKALEENVSIVEKLLKRNPNTACAAAQNIAVRKQ